MMLTSIRLGMILCPLCTSLSRAHGGEVPVHHKAALDGPEQALFLRRCTPAHVSNPRASTAMWIVIEGRRE
eukprot:3640843-Rhodomonas_salina.1